MKILFPEHKTKINVRKYFFYSILKPQHLRLRQVALYFFAERYKFREVPSLRKKVFIEFPTQISTLLTKIQIKLNLITISINQKLGTQHNKTAAAKEILALILIRKPYNYANTEHIEVFSWSLFVFRKSQVGIVISDDGDEIPPTPTATMEVVKRQLLNLHIFKSVLHSIILKELAEQPFRQLTLIFFCKSWNTREDPKDWEKDNGSILQKGKQDEPCNCMSIT